MTMPGQGPVFNRHAQRAAAVGGFGDGKKGNFFHISKQGAGRYVLRFMPPHPTKAPECLVYRPIHFIDSERVACLTATPQDLFPQFGQDCAVCEVVKYFKELADNNRMQYEIEVPQKRVRDILEKMQAKKNTHAFALLLQEGVQQHTPPKPITFVASAKTVVEVLDDFGFGRQDVSKDVIYPALTDPVNGKNFIISKSTEKNYDSVMWDGFPVPMIPQYCSQDLWGKMMQDYPDLSRIDYDLFKTYNQQADMLTPLGLMQ